MGFNVNFPYQSLVDADGDTLLLQGGMYYDLSGNSFSSFPNNNRGTGTVANPVYALDANGNVVGLNGPGGTVASSNIPFILKQGAVPSGIAPTGSVAANGALTLGTALPTTYSGGICLYFPAGAVYAGSVAGNYWCVMSSTTLGTVYDVKLGAGWPYVVPVASRTPIVDAGPGAYTGATTEITLATVTVPGGLMGANGSLRIDHSDRNNNSAGTKLARWVFTGTNYAYNVSKTTQVSERLITFIRNRGSQNIQIFSNYAGYGTFSSDPYTAAAVDTSVDVALAFKATCATGAGVDFLIFETAVVEVLPG